MNPALQPQWTDRSGQPTELAMTMFAPHIVIQHGFEVADYGNDEIRARRHYNKLVAAHRVQHGIKTVRVAA